MKRMVPYLLIVLMAVPLLVEGESGREALCREFMTVTGIREQVVSYSAVFLSSIDAQKANMDIRFYNTFKNSMAKALGEDLLFRDLETFLLREYNWDRCRPIMAFYEAPMGKRLRDVEVAATRVTEDVISAYAAELEKKGVPSDRKALILRMEKAMNMKQFNIDLFTAYMKITLNGINEGLPPEQRRSREEVEKQVSILKQRYVPYIETQVLGSLYYTYREIPVRDLEQYLKFLESPESLYFYSMYMRGINESFAALAGRFNEIFMKALNDEGKQG